MTKYIVVTLSDEKAEQFTHAITEAFNATRDVGARSYDEVAMEVGRIVTQTAMSPLTGPGIRILNEEPSKP